MEWGISTVLGDRRKSTRLLAKPFISPLAIWLIAISLCAISSVAAGQNPLLAGLDAVSGDSKAAAAGETDGDPLLAVENALAALPRSGPRWRSPIVAAGVRTRSSTSDRAR
jgi:hypothetical protein